MRPELRRWREPLATLVTAAICAGALAWAQLSFDGLFDGDSYFHTRAAQQLGEHGIRTQLPQAAFSTWKEGYSDKDFLFHVLLLPFCGEEGSLVPGGKRAAMLLDAVFFAALAGAVTALRLRFGFLWILLFFSSWSWLPEYLLAVRPQLLAMPLFVLEVILLLGGRWRALGVAAACHVLAHSSFVLVPALPLAQGAANRLRGLPFPGRSLAAAVGGVTLASLLHPYFPHNLGVSWDQLVEVARSVWWTRPEVPQDVFGSELLGMPLRDLLAAFPAWLPAATGLAAAAVWRGAPRLSARSLSLALLAAAFLVLSLLSVRFFPFFGVVSALLAGSLATELTPGWSWQQLGRRGSARAWGALALVVGCVVVGQSKALVLRIPEEVESFRSPEAYRPSVAFLSRVAAPQDQVYHSFWWAFSWLYHFRPDGRYVVGLDPIFLYRFDERLFRQMLEAHRGRGDVHAIISRDFGARWVFVERLQRTRPLRVRLAAEPRFQRRYRDRYAEVYEVLDAKDAGP